jgi:preprotein translocase subunit SecE
MNPPKLNEKKSESSGKVQSIETAKKATLKPTALKSKKTEVAKKTVKKPAEPRMAWVDTVRDYLREVVYELRKVVWPSRKETMGSTAVVLVIVGLSATFLGLVDFVLSRLVRFLVG